MLSPVSWLSALERDGNLHTLHYTMPLKIKLWKFFTHFAMLTSVQHLHGIFRVASACTTPVPSSNFKISKNPAKVLENRPNPKSLVCPIAKKFWRLYLKRRNILSSQEGGKTTKKPVHNVQLTVNFEMLFELKYRQRRVVVDGWLGELAEQSEWRKRSFFIFPPTTARKLCLYLPCFVYSGLLTVENSQKHRASSREANKNIIYLFHSTFMHPHNL